MHPYMSRKKFLSKIFSKSELHFFEKSTSFENYVQIFLNMKKGWLSIEKYICVEKPFCSKRLILNLTVGLMSFILFHLVLVKEELYSLRKIKVFYVVAAKIRTLFYN